MTRSLSTIVTLLLALNSLGAADFIRPLVEMQQTDQGIQIDLDFSGISQAQWKQMLENPNAFHEYGYGVSGQPGDAALPMLNILVPVTATAVPFADILETDEFPVTSLHLKSSPEGHLDSDTEPARISSYDWNRASRSPSTRVKSGEPMLLDGRRYLPVAIHPVQLMTGAQEVSVPRTMRVVLGGASLGDVSQISPDGGLLSVVTPGERFAPRGHYLIISPPQFISYMDYFAAWKTRMGYEVTTISTNAAGNSAAAIKNYIQTAWDTWESRPDFLVLVGDEDQGIPGHYIQNPQGHNLVTDHPYALLEGEDSFPELLVGRLSVDTVSELVAFTAKIVAYESGPYMTDTAWFERALMICTTWGAASTEATKEWVANKMLENGFDHIYTAYHPGVSSPASISNPINAGVGFVNYRGYGMYNGWFGPDFTNQNIYQLISSGPRTPVITSVVCGGGNFAATENDPCFGEVWTRIGTFSVPNGAVAFFGPSELYTHTQYNNVIDIGIYSGIFDQGISTLGAALWNGKYELWRNYHSNTYFPFGQTPEFYHHVYNLLGDPGMQLWTAVPRQLEVSHRDTLSTADNFLEVQITDESGLAVPGAYVALSNTSNASGGYTDAAGFISLPVLPGDGEALLITVTGKNLKPYLNTIPIDVDTHALDLANWELEDAAQPAAGDSTGMSLSFTNEGPTLQNVQISFTADRPGFVFHAPQVLDSIPGQSLFELTGIGVNIPDLPHGTPVTLQVELQTPAGTRTWQNFLVVQSPVLSISGSSLVNGVLQPGQSAQLQLELSNTGGVPSSDLTLIPLETEMVSITTASLDCPGVDVDDMSTTPDVLDLSFDEQLFPGENLFLRFQCISDGQVDTLTLNLELAGATRFGPSQRDAYGYRMFDGQDLNFSQAPVYEWIELDPFLGGNGSPVSVTDVWEEEDASQVRNLPFDVQYYGESFDQITICSNGWAAFGAQDVVNFHNRTIPSPIGPTAMLAPFWDDLVTANGGVYTFHDPVNDLYVIEWSRVQSIYRQTNISFQIVIYGSTLTPTSSGDNEIKFQYRQYANLDSDANFATIGIESPNSEVGIRASYNNLNDPSLGDFESGTVLLFTTERGMRLGASEIAFSSTTAAFELNPWSSARDSIMISNTGESPLLYEITQVSTLNLEPAPVIPHDPSITKDTPDSVNPPSGLREGSDAYGYTWKDNHDAGGPEYHWINIEIEANRQPYPTLEFDDTSVGPLLLGFDFPLYDEVYSQCFMGSNGTLTFESIYSPWYNIFMPSGAAPSSIIAPWWDDLNNDAGPQGTLYFWTNEVDQAVLTWKHFPKHGTDSFYSFQVVLDIYGNIKFQYQEMGEIIASSTIGMQNADRNMGLTIRHNETTPMEGGTAISIEPPNQWFAATGWSRWVGAGESVPFVMDIEARNSAPGHYETALLVITTAPNAPETSLIVSMDVVAGETPFGDINGDYLVNLHDVTVLFDYILMLVEISDLESEVADLSDDGHVDIRDVVLLIEAMEMNVEPGMLMEY